MFAVGMGLWWAMFTIGRGLWWAMFIVHRGSVGTESGPLSLLVGWCWAVVIFRGHWFVGWCWAVFAIGGVVLVVGHCCHCWWGGAGPLSSLVGWCWAIVIIHGVVLGRCWRSWGGAGPLLAFVGWCWAWVLVADAGGGDGPLSWWVVVGPHSCSCHHLAVA